MKNIRSLDPIGIFDSGVGGLTVANAVHRLLPNEQIIYFGDTAHLPYGDKSPEAIKYYATSISAHLVDKKCKAVVVACNSASTTAFSELSEFLDDKAIFIDVVQPLVEHTARLAPKKVGLIATKATVDSGVYQSQLQKALPKAQIIARATPLLVPMIEEGFVNNEVSQTILKEYLHSPEFEDLDVLLLACTHYPLIKDAIGAQLPGVTILDSTEVTAQALKTSLSKLGLFNNKEGVKSNSFLVSDYTRGFEQKARLFFGKDVDLKEDNIW